MATAIIYEGMMIDLANSVTITQTRATALDTAVAAITNVATARIDIVGAERRKPGRRFAKGSLAPESLRVPEQRPRGAAHRASATGDHSSGAGERDQPRAEK
jgi:hypothetical protein